jgi:hypothetical protein
MENTVIEAKKFLDNYEEINGELNLSDELKEKFFQILYGYANVLTKYKLTDKQRIRRNIILSDIRQNIIADNKHPRLDSADVAARKIYSTYFTGENSVLVTAIEGDYCAVCGCNEFWNDDNEDDADIWNEEEEEENGEEN